jgi:hypothetical protein
MPLEIFNCEQGSPEWFECRLGIPTASRFATVLASGRGGGESKTRRKYLYQLAGEVLTQEPMENWQNEHMKRGHEMEPDARNLYIFLTDLEPVQVGFIRNGNKGCSPDSLIGNDGMLEIKTKLADLQCEVLDYDELPPEHKAQCQGNLWVAEREWIDFVSYWPKLPLFAKRVYRDEPYIKKLAAEVDQFNNELAELVQRIDRLRTRKAA